MQNLTLIVLIHVVSTVASSRESFRSERVSPFFEPPLKSSAASDGKAAELARWRGIHRLHLDIPLLASSLVFDQEYHYLSRNKDRVIFDITYRSNWKHVGKKFVVTEIGEGRQVAVSSKGLIGNDLRPVKLWWILAFDGGSVRQKGSNKLFTVAADPALTRPACPPCWQAADLIDDSVLQRKIETREFDLDGLRDDSLDKRRMIVASFSHADTRRKAIEIWYDVGRGYVPVASRQFAESGAVMAESKISDILEYTSAHNLYFLPVAGSARAFDAEGNVIEEREYRVNSEGVRFDSSVPDEQFRLKADVGENEYDALSRTLWQPAKAMPGSAARDPAGEEVGRGETWWVVAGLACLASAVLACSIWWRSILNARARP